VQRQTTEAITTVVVNGRKAMPAFGKTLDAAAIKQVVDYVRTIAAK
jgi:mono/diheme cytochrome c family protein